MIALTVITGDLITAVIGAIVVCAIMYIPRKIISSEDLFPILSRGFSDMLVVDIVLLLTFVLQIITGKMGMTDYIIEKVQPYMIGSLFPVMILCWLPYCVFAQPRLLACVPWLHRLHFH